MILFIHGLYQTSSSFLPFIKKLFDLNSVDQNPDKFTDKFLLDIFCLNVAGYDLPDSSFLYRDLEKNILESLTSRHQAQLDIANKLVLSNPVLSTNLLKDPRINIVGQDVGAVCGLYFLANYGGNSGICKSLVLIDCGVNFGSILEARAYKLESFWTKRTLKQPISKIQIKYDKTKIMYDKNFLATALHYPQHQGIKSYTKILDNYDFKGFFGRLSIEEQKDFNNTPILVIGNSKTGFSNISSLKKIPKIIYSTKQFINKKHTIISTKNTKSMIKIETIKSESRNLVDPENFEKLSEILNSFYIF